MRMVPQLQQQQQAAAAAASTTPPVATNILTTGLDMIENFNFSQIGDAVTALVKNPITSLEQFANVLLSGAAIAGVPFASTAEAILPVAENLINLVQKIIPAAGGVTGAAATTAAAISSPPALAITVAPVPPSATGSNVVVTDTVGSTKSIATSDLTTGLDILHNLNAAQIGDALGEFSTNPLTAVEDLATTLINSAAVAGVKVAQSVQQALPVAEGIFGFIQSFLPAFGGTTGTAASTATAISSPRWLGAPNAI